MSGCAFHWTQAVWRFTQGKGLQTAFSTDPATHCYIKQLLALPYLPHQEIGPCLAELRQEASTDSLKDVCKYIKDTWIDSRVWPPSTWYAIIMINMINSMMYKYYIKQTSCIYIYVYLCFVFSGLCSTRLFAPTMTWRAGTDGSTQKLEEASWTYTCSYNCWERKLPW